MNKNLIKQFASNLTEDDIVKYLNKECVCATKSEILLIYNLIKKDIDIILECDFYEYILNYKSSLNENLYNKIIEKYEKYKSFIK